MLACQGCDAFAAGVLARDEAFQFWARPLSHVASVSRLFRVVTGRGQ